MVCLLPRPIITGAPSTEEIEIWLLFILFNCQILHMWKILPETKATMFLRTLSKIWSSSNFFRSDEVIPLAVSSNPNSVKIHILSNMDIIIMVMLTWNLTNQAIKIWDHLIIFQRLKIFLIRVHSSFRWQFSEDYSPTLVALLNFKHEIAIFPPMFEYQSS